MESAQKENNNTYESCKSRDCMRNVSRIPRPAHRNGLSQVGCLMQQNFSKFSKGQNTFRATLNILIFFVRERVCTCVRACVRECINCSHTCVFFFIVRCAFSFCYHTELPKLCSAKDLEGGRAGGRDWGVGEITFSNDEF
jgi:hypothetical protein